MYYIWETKPACDFAVLVLQCKFATSPSAQPDWYVVYLIFETFKTDCNSQLIEIPV